MPRTQCENRYKSQFQHALDIWLSKDGNSLLQIAKMVRVFGDVTGQPIDFDESILIAQNLSKGRHQ